MFGFCSMEVNVLWFVFEGVSLFDVGIDGLFNGELIIGYSYVEMMGMFIVLVNVLVVLGMLFMVIVISVL